MTFSTPSALRREKLAHPVIDSLVHSVEFLPVLEDFIRTVGGAKLIDLFRRAISAGRFQSNSWYGMSRPQRMDARCARPPWWAMPTERTIDLAAVSLPALLSERLEAHGTDFAIVYSNVATFAVLVENADLRIPLCRAVNLYQAELFGHRPSIAAAAAIPLFTPEEGIEELDFAVRRLGLKVALITGGAPRPIRTLAMTYPKETYPDLAPYLTWFDAFGVDSAHDYDPFWSKAVEIGIPLMVHRGTQGWTPRSSISNYTYNQIGHFAAGSEVMVRSLFLSGTTRRFPRLRIGLLEGGTGYAVNLIGDLLHNWERRGGTAISRFDPEKLDTRELFSLYRRHGGGRINSHLTTAEALGHIAYGINQAGQGDTAAQGELDDFAAAGIAQAGDIPARFVPNFYFGVESDDPALAPAFNTRTNPMGVKLNAFWATDSGHWDVPDMTRALENTWRFVEGGVITESNFRDLVFEAPYRLYTSANPSFFDGTSLSDYRSS